MQISSDLEQIIRRTIADENFAAEVGQKPDIVDLITGDKRIVKSLKDPIMFSLLLCGQSWLTDPKAQTHRKFLVDESGRLVSVCGRGWGKSLEASLKAVNDMFHWAPVEVVIVSSSQRQSMQIFDYLWTHMHRTQTLRRTITRETRTMIQLKKPFESKVWALPCSENKLRGKHPDELIVDEASIIPPEMISSELLFMLTKKYPKGSTKQYPQWPKLQMLGTPFAYEHPFRLAFNNPEFHKYHEASYNSPLVNEAMLNEWKGMMTSEEWEREVEAKWVELENAYFPLSLINSCVDTELDLIESIDNIPYWVQHSGTNFGGLDLGKQRSFSAFSVVNFNNDKGIRHVFAKYWPLGTPYAEVEQFVAEAGKRFNLGNLAIDSTGVGDRVLEEMIRISSLPIEGIFLTDVVKEDIFSATKLGMEKKAVKITDWKMLITQLSEQTYEYLRPKQAEERLHLKFKKPQHKYDDVLISFLLACWGALKVRESRPWVGGVKKAHRAAMARLATRDPWVREVLAAA